MEVYNKRKKICFHKKKMREDDKSCVLIFRSEKGMKGGKVKGSTSVTFTTSTGREYHFFKESGENKESWIHQVKVYELSLAVGKN